MDSRSRIVYLDLIRIIACILVVMVHVSAQLYDYFPAKSTSNAVVCTYNCIAFCGVAFFAMISGALSFDNSRESSIRSILIHKALHFFILYYIWKAFYQIIAMIEVNEPFTIINIKNEIILASVLKRGAGYQLWYLPMIAMLYMFVPLIKKSLADKRVSVYFLIVFFITQIFFPTLFQYEFRFKYIFEAFFEDNDFYLFSGYLGYMILGHYLHNQCDSIPKKIRVFIYIGGIGSVFFIFFCGNTLSTPFAVTTFLMVTAIYIAMKNVAAKMHLSKRSEILLKWSSKSSLGVYLLHPLVLWGLFRVQDYSILAKNPFLSIPVTTLCIFIVCSLFSILLLKIPLLRRLVQ